ncbi:phosphomannomutase [Anaerospora hongkongensis]|uniref:phosphomannomutase n=1 Tax=Anaerospora hongkongensis TaxID=244830 RepID=UPI0028A12BA4|nr:phosphomannomutase [Anaerospora hongkongensis]
MSLNRTAFKAYDIRGKVPQELNEELTYRIGRAYAELLGAKKVVVGRDVRLTSEPLAAALIQGLTDAGCDVLDLGLCGTEQVYFATFYLATDGGIMVTASHNPMDYNGLKLVKAGAKPISGDTGLRDIEDLAVPGRFLCPLPEKKGNVTQISIMDRYIQHLLGYVDVSKMRPIKIVVNAGNGCAGPVLDALEKILPFQFIKLHNQPDGTFPQGIPNPLLPENREATAQAVRDSGADIGIAWDGDFDRCFFFDEIGNFVEGYYIVGLLAQAFLTRQPGSKIIYDPRLTWNTIELVDQFGGIPIQSKTGHAFIKERMRKEDAVYGGEMSAHHYFREFAYCDSGMIPWLLVTALMCEVNKPLSMLVNERMMKYPCSGEINRTVADAKKVLELVEDKYIFEGAKVDRTDGLGVEYDAWRFNLRTSNTEPVIRLNVESRGDISMMETKTNELLAYIDKIKKC